MASFPDAENVCEQVLEAVRHSGPPTDLNSICSLWPGLDVEEEDLDKEGYLISLGALGSEILIRKSDPPVRKKFTLAHELGHWALANMKGDRISLGGTNGLSLPLPTEHKRHNPEEAWCNKFAACLLMPIKDIHQYLYGPGGGNLAERISQGHSVFQVSQEAFLSRVRETTPVSVFEVVSADSNAKVRRSFLSVFQRDEDATLVLEKLLGGFHRTNDLPQGPVDVDHWQMQAALTRSSHYSRAWLVAVAPFAIEK